MVKKARQIMNKNYLKLYTTDILSEALGKLKKKKESYVLVFTGTEKLVGVISRRNLLKSRVDPHTTKVGGLRKLIKRAPKCEAGDDIIKVAELMLNAYPCCVAVMQGDKVSGVVGAKDLLAEIKSFKTLSNMRASDVMTSKPITARYDTRVGDALNIMREKSIGHLPVVDSVDGHLISILSFADLAEHVLIYPRHKQKGIGRYGEEGASGKGWSPKDKILLDAPIGDLASVISVTAKESDDLKALVNKLNKYNASDLVITESNKPIGIVTIRDLLEVFVKLKEPEFWDVHYIGADHLKPFQARALKEVVNEKFEKMRRDYFNIEDLVYLAVHVKFYEEGGFGKRPKHGRTKYSVRLRLAMPAFIVIVDESHFNLMTAVQWALDKLDRKVRDRKIKVHKKGINYGKGRRAMFQHFIRKKAASLDLRPAFAKLVKRK